MNHSKLDGMRPVFKALLKFAAPLLVGINPLLAMSDSLDAGEKMQALIAELRPTQFVVGMKEVQIRKAKLERLRGEPDELKKYMKENRARVVVGPGDRLYLIDGHHFARTLEESGFEKIYVEIEKNYSDLTTAEFWEKMEKKNWVYLKDEAGKLRSARELPVKISQLADDPYRSLAWLVRKAGGYEALETPFQEFHWADFYRSRIAPFDARDDDAFDRAFRQALTLSRSPSARDLPGYSGKMAVRSCTLGKLLLSL